LCQPATVVFHPPHEAHVVDFGNNVRILSVQFSFEELARIREQSTVLNSLSSCQTETVAWIGARLLQELRRTDEASGLALEGLVLELLAETS
jgi:AraC family transcriptional regulator